MFRDTKEPPLDRLELDRYQSELGKPTKLGEALTFVGHPFAEPVNNSSLLQMAIDRGMPADSIETAEQVIAKTGFTHRYLSRLPEQELDVAKVVDRTTTIGAILLQHILKANGWEDGIDVFIDTSAFLPATVNQGILAKSWLNPDRIVKRTYRYACAGAVAAFIDCLSDPSLQDTRIVIAALEPLSQLISHDHFLTPESLAIPGIFGDAHTLMAFNPTGRRCDQS